MSSATTTLTSSCHCGATAYAFTVPTASLPLHTHLCHCNISRRISGALCTSYVPIPPQHPPTAPALAPLTRYDSSAVLSRYFCSACGAHLFLRYAADAHWEAATGSLDRSDGAVRFDGHMWVGDTRDGGASDWIPRLAARPARRWLVAPHASPEVPLGWRGGRGGGDDDGAAPPPPPPPPTTGAAGADADDDADADADADARAERLRAHCHCNGVDFFLTRPTASPPAAAPAAAPAPFPDLLVPHRSGRSPANPGSAAWWLSGCGRRYVAGACACRSCRRASGFDVAAWAFVPRANVVLASGAPLPLPGPGAAGAPGAALGTLRPYASSAGVVRWFCGRCGASVFWEGEGRPAVLDVAVGLLDAPEGARADGWLEWAPGRVSFAEEALSREVVEGLEAGLRQWARREGGVA